MRKLIEKELGMLTQTKLAQKIGVSQATIHKILYTDTTLTVPTLEKLARYFRMPVSHLLDSEETIHSPETTLSIDEQKLLVWYRHLCSTDHEDEALKYVKFLAESYGFKHDHGSIVTNIKNG